MDKTIRIILIAILGILLLNMVFSFFGVNSNLKKVINKMEASEKKLDESIKELHLSRTKVDSVRAELEAFRLYVKDIQGRVEILDLERRVNQDKFRRQKDTIQSRLKDLYKDVETTGQGLPITEVLH